jgi:hypothetical protein
MRCTNELGYFFAVLDAELSSGEDFFCIETVISNIESIVDAIDSRSKTNSDWKKSFYDFYSFLNIILQVLTRVGAREQLDYSNIENISKRSVQKDRIVSSLKRFLVHASSIRAECVGYPDYSILDLYYFTPIEKSYSSKILYEQWGLIVKPCVPCFSVEYLDISDVMTSIIGRSCVPENMINQLVIDYRLYDLPQWSWIEEDKDISSGIMFSINHK